MSMPLSAMSQRHTLGTPLTTGSIKKGKEIIVFFNNLRQSSATTTYAGMIQKFYNLSTEDNNVEETGSARQRLHSQRLDNAGLL